VWVAVGVFGLSILRDIPVVHGVSSWAAPLLTHPLLIAVFAAILLAAKHPRSRGRLHRWAIWARIAVLTVWLQSACIFHEACRSYPRVTRELYTRTRVGQRRAFGSVRRPAPVRPKFRNHHRSSLHFKAKPQAAKARVASILARLAKDAAASKRRRLGLSPDDNRP
jgi:hypothetical protein